MFRPMINIIFSYHPFSVPQNPIQSLPFLPSLESHSYYNCKKAAISSGNQTYHTNATIPQCFGQRNTAPSMDLYFHDLLKTYSGKRKRLFRWFPSHNEDPNTQRTSTSCQRCNVPFQVYRPIFRCSFFPISKNLSPLSKDLALAPSYQS
jgi:hypothetical protein